jgi:hypothetical protein
VRIVIETIRDVVGSKLIEFWGISSQKLQTRNLYAIALTMSGVQRDE